MKGWIVKLIIDNNLFMIELFKIFRIGIAWINNESGKAYSLIIGLWKFEANLTFALRKRITWNEIGEA
jgi:hypothetical protein